MALKWSVDEISFLKGNAFSMKASEIAKVLGKSTGAIYTYASKNKISLANKLKQARIHSFNQAFFKDIDIARKAYWLGALWADGCVNYEKRYAIALSVNKKDLEWVRAFREDLNAQYPIHVNDKRQCVTLQIYSKATAQDLIKHGVVPRKSYAGEIPMVCSNLASHFVRGIFDGDGSLFQMKKGKRRRVSIVNTAATCEWVSSILHEQIGHGGHIYNTSHNCKLFVIILDNEIQDFCSWLYRDAKRYLKRKRDRFIELGFHV